MQKLVPRVRLISHSLTCILPNKASGLLSEQTLPILIAGSLGPGVSGGHHVLKMEPPPYSGGQGTTVTALASYTWGRNKLSSLFLVFSATRFNLILTYTKAIHSIKFFISDLRNKCIIKENCLNDKRRRRYQCQGINVKLNVTILRKVTYIYWHDYNKHYL